MSERPVVLTDLDGVKADFHGRVIAVIKSEYPDVDTARSYANFYVAKDFPEMYEQARAISDREGFFTSLDVIDGAIQGWQKMIDAGYQPRVCSSPLLTHPDSKGEKLAWLEEHFVPHFGPQVIDDALIVKDKTGCEGLALIDDKPVITGAHIPAWKHILFTRSYNVAQDAEYRLNGWNDDRLIPMLGAIATLQNKN